MRSLTLLGALLVASLCGQTTAAPEDPPSFSTRLRCRCLPSQPCWPSESSWSAFNQTVGGRLISTTPAAYQCHDPHYDSAKCQEIQKGYYWDYWRQEQPGAVQQTNWEMVGDKGCLGFNQTAPCHQGAVPVYTVKAMNIEDVQNTVRFAAKNNVRLVIKNTGHDYLGRSIGASSLNLWVFYMKDLSFNDQFVPEGAPTGTNGQGAVILGTGVLWKDVYKAADEHNVNVVGGAEATVGTSGGYCQGGGHSPMSPLHGLCVDNVLQYKVVTADGEVKVANAYQNKDLFWALRGGGGSTFGVVVEAIYKTHPAMKSVNYAFYVVSYNETETRRKVVNNYLSHQVAFSEAGWSGYTYIMKRVMIIMYYLPNADTQTANSTLAPFFDYVGTLGDVAVKGDIRNYASFWDSFSGAGEKVQTNSTNAGTNTLLGSRLIPRVSFESSEGVSKLTDALLNIQTDLEHYGNEQGAFITHLVAGGAVRNGTTAETSVLPAWRKALIHIVAMAFWEDSTPVATQNVIARKLTAATQRLRDLTPGSGAYMNEADSNEPNWQEAFFGSNYRRLKSIKDQVDPQGLFACRKCVGSEDWSNDLMCPRRQ